jgi:Calcineurin-like phosphoesterase
MIELARNRIIVIGDVHGDLQRLAHCFIKAGLINHQYQWTAQPPDTWVVQLGDQVDSLSRGADDQWETLPDIKVVEFMQQMDALARPFGGRVVSLIGNHELMNTMGDFTYVSAKSLKETGGVMGRTQKFRPGGPFANLLADRPVIAKIGSLVFCHAGILPSHLAMAGGGVRAIGVINDWARRYLRYEPIREEEVPRLRSVLIDTEGILWNRHYADASPENESERRTSLETVLGSLGARAMFVGHTTVPQILALYDRRIWFVDNGLSRAFQSGPIQILEILNDGVPLPENGQMPYRTISV